MSRCGIFSVTKKSRNVHFLFFYHAAFFYYLLDNISPIQYNNNVIFCERGLKVIPYFNLVLVDDEPLSLEYLKDSIDWISLGFQVAGAFDNAKDALQFMDKQRVDVILSDIRMPDMTGLELARICSETYPDTVVVLMSAYRDFEYARSAIQYNVKDYIVKPLSYTALKSTMEAVCEQLKENPGGEPNADADLSDKQQLFIDLLSGLIPNEDMLKTRLDLVGLSSSLINSPCVFFSIYVLNLADFFKDGAYSLDRFYTAVSNFLSYENTYSQFVSVGYCQNNLDIIGILLNDDAGGVSLLDSIRLLETDFSNDLNLSVRINIKESFISLRELVHAKTIKLLDEIDISDDIVKKANEYINKNYANDISLSEIANHVSLSPTYFSNIYKQKANETFISALTRLRMEKAKALLEDPTVKASLIFELVGYKSYSHFFKTFKKYYNITPSKYQSLYCKRGTIDE